MSFIESFAIAFDALRANKMRSFLTMLGIIIGVGAVIAVVAIGQGGQAMVIKEIEGIGAGMVWVQPKFDPSRAMDIKKIELLKPEDMKVIAQVPGIVDLSPEIRTGGTVKHGSEALDIGILGTSAGYGTVRNVKVATGRFLSRTDVEGSARVAVIGAGVSEKFFGKVKGIGQVIHINGLPYTVIGVLENSTGLMAQSGDNANARFNVYIPYTTMQRIVGTEDITVIYVKPETPARTDQVVKAMQVAMDRLHGAGKFEVMSMDTIVKSVKTVTNILTSVVAGVAAIALLVGGIGIMNIMLVSVTERTREVGLRKAIGATRQDLLWQFLIEAVVVSVVGGCIGIGFGGALVFLVSKLGHLPGLISAWSVALAFFFSLLVGVVFGVYPANKAARLDPIEALRYE
ncbi:MAG: ABC transporter permease [Symbiobacteriia bacterium]